MEGVAVVNVALLGILAIGAISGGMKGFARQVIELLGLVVSFFVAAVIATRLSSLLADHTPTPHSAALVIAFLMIFIGGMVAFHFVAISAQRVIHMTFFGWVDRLCGALVGLLAAMLLASVLVTVALELPISSSFRSSIEHSSVGAFVHPMAGWLFDAVFPRGDGRVA